MKAAEMRAMAHLLSARATELPNQDALMLLRIDQGAAIADALREAADFIEFKEQNQQRRRDEFAMTAMGALLVGVRYPDEDRRAGFEVACARASYGLADAMLAEREARR